MAQDNSDPCYVAAAADSEAIQHLKQAIAGGRPWHVALLAAIGLWSWPDKILYISFGWLVGMIAVFCIVIYLFERDSESVKRSK